MTATVAMAPASPDRALRAIEALYAGPLGAQYLAAHPHPDRRRRPFWERVRLTTQPERVLEVGCGAGGNLALLGAPVPQRVGLDCAAGALRAMRRRLPAAQGVQGSAGALPFRDGAFDLVITSGLLIHVPEPALRGVLQEVGRVSRCWVLLVEYEDTHRREIPWRGQRDVLWAGPFGLDFWRACPHYRPVWRGDLTLERDGWDRCGAALFTRRAFRVPRDPLAFPVPHPRMRAA